MKIEQLYTNNNMRNFNYLIICEETGEALAIDPFAADLVLEHAKKLGVDITQILNTHEHWDHIGGNETVVNETKAKVYAHAKAEIPDVDVGLSSGDSIRIGKTVELEVLDTPGHTMSHVCLYAHSDKHALFSGDTLFNAGCGNCKAGGHPEALYHTFSQILFNLDPTTEIYPGHDYLQNNLEFCLDREPDNVHAKTLLEKLIADEYDPNNPMVTNLSLEKEINPFLRLNSPSIIKTLKERVPELPESANEAEVFLALRELRNSW